MAETTLQTKLGDMPITASPVKMSRDDDPDAVPAQMQDTKTDWTHRGHQRHPDLKIR